MSAFRQGIGALAEMWIDDGICTVLITLPAYCHRSPGITFTSGLPLAVMEDRGSRLWFVSPVQDENSYDVALRLCLTRNVSGQSELMKVSVQSADHRTARLDTDVNITGHQTKTEPKDYTAAHDTQQRARATKGREEVGGKQRGWEERRKKCFWNHN